MSLEIRQEGDPNDVFVRVCEADLVRIPEFMEIMKKHTNCKVEVFDAEATVLTTDESHTIWVGHNGYDKFGHNYRITGQLPLEAVQEFMVLHMNANPDTMVERLKQGEEEVFKQRTIDNYLVTCERYVTYHKSFTPTEKNLARHNAFVDETRTGGLWNEDAIADSLGGAE